MSEVLDEALFEGKTYGDLVKERRRPGILIHASDMATLSRFEFIQPQFDLICSDLSQLPISRASAASAALPLVLSPITLKNYAGECGYEPPAWLLESAKSAGPIRRQRAREMLSYLDIKKRPHVHLLDGGLSDNIALRSVLEGAAVAGGAKGIGGLESMAKRAGIKNVQKLVIISVSAETSPDVNEYRSDKIPVLTRAMDSLVDIPINRYSADTLVLMRVVLETWRNDLKNRPPGAESIFAPNADIYFIDVSLGAVEDPVEQEYLMKIPTTLYLTDEQIDRLLLAASRLIRNDKEFQRLMKDLQ